MITGPEDNAAEAEGGQVAHCSCVAVVGREVLILGPLGAGELSLALVADDRSGLWRQVTRMVAR